MSGTARARRAESSSSSLYPSSMSSSSCGLSRSSSSSVPFSSSSTIEPLVSASSGSSSRSRAPASALPFRFRSSRMCGSDWGCCWAEVPRWRPVGRCLPPIIPPGVPATPGGGSSGEGAAMQTRSTAGSSAPSGTPPSGSSSSSSSCLASEACGTVGGRGRPLPVRSRLVPSVPVTIAAIDAATLPPAPAPAPLTGDSPPAAVDVPSPSVTSDSGPRPRRPRSLRPARPPPSPPRPRRLSFALFAAGTVSPPLEPLSLLPVLLPPPPPLPPPPSPRHGKQQRNSLAVAFRLGLSRVHVAAGAAGAAPHHLRCNAPCPSSCAPLFRFFPPSSSASSSSSTWVCFLRFFRGRWPVVAFLTVVASCRFVRKMAAAVPGEDARRKAVSLPSLWGFRRKLALPLVLLLLLLLSGWLLDIVDIFSPSHPPPSWKREPIEARV
uniref:Uncharacterized protein n=1 Tax=Anopheles farauti TaxID=69004 RepID=A0A182Q553_9DIPT